MQYTENEAALIGGLISNYFFQPSVDAKLRESYRRVLRHLHENTLSTSAFSFFIFQNQDIGGHKNVCIPC